MSELRLDPMPMPRWPPLAWLATMRPGDPRIELRHGRQVEVTPEFACEAVWDGRFEDGDFDTTDIVSGSGVRLRGEEAIFVSPGSTIDRLVSQESPEATRVSNSLVCLLAAIGGELDPAYPDYFWDFYTIIYGLERYKRELETSAGIVELTYFHNLAWDGRALSLRHKPFPRRDFSTYARYRGHMSRWMDATARNLADERRARPWGMISTLSSGYDSAAVSAIAAESGLKEALCFDRSRGGENDSGEEVARHLGLEPVVVRRDGWRREPFVEVPFIAANAFGEEAQFAAGAEHVAGKVLFTGHRGDRTWKTINQGDDGDLQRIDPGGLALTEYRLHADFIVCPMPYWAARQVNELVALTLSPEMEPWDTPADYRRPVCRRIVEEAGVPREAFGQRKLATSVLMHKTPDFLSPESMDDYLEWLRASTPAFLARRRPPPLPSRGADRALTRLQQEGRRGLRRARRTPTLTRLPGLPLAERLIDGSWNNGMEPQPRFLRRYAMPWAVERTKRAYAQQP